MIGVYMRVSTISQENTMQAHAIQEWLAQHKPMAAYRLYQETASGKKDDRVELARLSKDIEAGIIQTVVVYRLDRLSRKATTALSMLLNWLTLGVEFFATAQPVLSASKDDPFRLTKLAMFSELAQIERETIVGRVKSGLAAARARGVKLGKPSKLTVQQLNSIAHMRNCGKTVRQTAAEMGVSIATISRLGNKAKKVAS